MEGFEFMGFQTDLYSQRSWNSARCDSRIEQRGLWVQYLDPDPPCAARLNFWPALHM